MSKMFTVDPTRIVCLLFLVSSWSWGNQTIIASKIQVPGQISECYVRPGDVNIGILSPLRSAGDSNDFCQEGTFSWIGFQILEAYIYAIDMINYRTDILPNVSLGFAALDDCFWDLAALAKALYFLPVEGMSTTLKASNCSESFQQFHVAGVMGLSNSRKAVMVSSLLSIFHIPVVGTVASSDELSDKSRYEYFLRVIPPDRMQAEAIVNFVQYFQWTYVSLLYSEGSYGEFGARQIEKGTNSRGICIAYSKMIVVGSDSEDYIRIITQLLHVKEARVVILFVSYDNAIKLFEAVDETQTHGLFIWIAADAVGTRDLLPSANGTIAIRSASGDDPEYDKYFRSLTPQNTPQNPWIWPYWETVYDCKWDAKLSNKSCWLYYNITTVDKQINTVVYKGIDAVYTYAYALNATITKHCPEAFINISALDGCISGNELLNTMKNTTFQGVTGYIKFDAAGDMMGQYDFVQHLYYKTERTLSEIATWGKDMHDVHIDQHKIDWSPFEIEQNIASPKPESICSRPCLGNEYKVKMELPCCWDCRTCRENEIMINNKTGCQLCPPNYWPDGNSTTVCEAIDPTFIKWTDTLALVLVSLAVLGILAWVATLSVYCYNWNIKLIKASSRELNVVIMTGILLAYIGALVLLWHPNKTSCQFRHYIFNLSVALIYSPLLVKTNRVYRIFAAGKKGNNPPWISTRSQIAFTVTILIFQVSHIPHTSASRRSQIAFTTAIRIVQVGHIPHPSACTRSQIVFTVTICIVQVRHIPHNIS